LRSKGKGLGFGEARWNWRERAWELIKEGGERE